MYDQYSSSRRNLLINVGRAAAALGSVGLLQSTFISRASAETEKPAGELAQLTRRLAEAPRRRQFKTVPMIVTKNSEWDHEAANEVLAYSYKSRQAWDNFDLSAPWPGLMRESMNGHVFSLGSTDFLAVSATHGEAHLALFRQVIWDKYNLANLVNRKFTSNSLIVERAGVSPTDDLQNPVGFYGPMNNNIISLQKRGAVFIACHDSIHAFARKLASNAAFAEKAPDEIAADLTNNLIPGVVLVPSVVAFIGELQRVGYTYVNAG